MKRRYEIRDDQWERIKDLLPAERKPQRGRPPKDHRLMLNAMLWVARTGAPWRDLPEHYGSWSSAYSRFRRWEKAGIWDKHIYKERHLIECFFNKVKNYRRLATRFDKLACTFKAFLTLASIFVWLT